MKNFCHCLNHVSLDLKIGWAITFVRIKYEQKQLRIAHVSIINRVQHNVRRDDTIIKLYNYAVHML